MSRHILVTGGAGFLGSHLCSSLVKEGAQVTAIDNLYTGNLENISSLLNLPNFTFIKHDITNPINLEVDEIFNLACPASPPVYQRDPIFTMKTNVIGILNMLELAQKNSAKILQASTSEVYGDPTQHPQSEDYRGNVNPIGVRACYDEGKRAAETLCFDYHRKYKVNIKVVRIFNTYGPHMNPKDGRVISNFIVQALQGKPLEVYGNGMQTRSFCYVDDLVRGIITVMESSDEIQGPFNLGNSIERSVFEIAKFICTLTGSSSKIIFKPLPKDDPIRRCPDISLAQKKLDWNHHVTLEEGLGRTIEYFKKII